MKDIAEVHFRVIEKGIFLPIARRLAREARKVSYWTPWETAFPTVKGCIGDGLPDVERVYSPWKDKDDVDCWVFPDIGFAPMQEELLMQGKIVWGARDADSIELSRGKFLDVLSHTKLPMPPHKVLVGYSALKRHLIDQKDKYIKVSKFRGDWETMHWRDWDEDELELDARACKLGPFKEEMSFYVFDKIDTKIEDGCDSWCIDGAYPSLVIHGMEAKDKAYIGTFQKFSELPEEVRRVNDEFGPILAEYGYRSFFSTEVRITEEGESYFIDPTMRAGSPPSQVMCEMIENFPEIIWKGAQGECIDPVPAAKFGVQALVCIKGDRTSWKAMEIPPQLDQWLKCGFYMEINGRMCFPPMQETTGNDIGWLLGIGDTAKEAIDHLKSNNEMLPDDVTCEFWAIADLLKEVDEAEKHGMEWTDQPVPSPEVVLDKG